MIYRKFKIDEKFYTSLSKEDKEVVKILEEVVKDIAKVYELQLKDGFYPKGIDKARIERAAKAHPLILSPFTLIEKRGGHLHAVPYHEKYADLLKPIAQKIESAAKISVNASFKRYLKARAKSLLDGSYREADITWLEVKDLKIDFNIGPVERYLDKILFIKRVYQAHVGIIDNKLTEAANGVKEVLYASAKISFDTVHSTFIPKKGVTLLVEETPVTSGYIADIVFSGEHFPSDLDLVQKYGSKVLIYASQLRLKFYKMHYPVFKEIFEERFAAKYSKELLLRATGWMITLHEVGRQLHKYVGARERLKEYYGPIDEANTAVSGVQHAKHLVVKGLISPDDLEAIIIMHIVRFFSEWLLYRRSGVNESHVKAAAIALNAYLNSGALKVQKGISWPNFTKIFFEIEHLADTLVNLLQEGSYEEAKRFVEENAGFKNLEQLSKNLKNLNLTI